MRTRHAVLLLALGTAPLAQSAQAGDPAEEPTWRFRKADKPVKVVVLAGSIGAKQNGYAKHIQQMCSEVEVKNMSKTGAGAWELKKRLRDQVFDNRYLNLRREGYEHWLVYQGGLNSVAMPEKTNRYIRETFLAAHKKGMKVVGFSLTPWGADKDKKRWGPVSGFRYRRDTAQVVDFVMKRLDPKTALGVHRERRDSPDGPWSPDELADVAVDLYDSPLRNADAPLRDVEAMKSALAADRGWKKAHAELDESARAAALDADAREASEVPRWFMKPEYRSFDHIHPNAEGHKVIADVACPSLPASWGCSCSP